MFASGGKSQTSSKIYKKQGGFFIRGDSSYEYTWSRKVTTQFELDMTIKPPPEFFLEALDALFGRNPVPRTKSNNILGNYFKCYTQTEESCLMKGLGSLRTTIENLSVLCTEMERSNMSWKKQASIAMMRVFPFPVCAQTFRVEFKIFRPSYSIWYLARWSKNLCISRITPFVSGVLLVKHRRIARQWMP